MRAMTVRQPWGWAIVHGGKPVENRSRNIAGSYRGLVAIHAGLTDASDAPSDITEAWRRWWSTADEPGQQRGAIIGVANLVDVHLGDCFTIETYREGHPQAVGTCSPWAMVGFHHLVLANPRPLAVPVPAKGRLGLWTLPDDVAAAVLAGVVS